jgi:threonylcarbamoyladenosine tRNA methylthiotransferase MtaB
VKIAFKTLGCKINQYDTASMKEQAARANGEIVAFRDRADVYVINTCSVTGKSDYRSRQLIRRALKQNPGARIVVTGCYAQTHPEEVMAIPGVDLVLGTQERGNWLDFLGGCDRAAAPARFVRNDFAAGPLDQEPVLRFGDRTRAFVKIQDGCDAKCSFCLIPRARGPGRSVPEDRVIEQIRALAHNQCKEVVLTGVNLGFYGRDFQPKRSLAGLVKKILLQTDIPRVRLSSVEPKTVTRALIDTVASSPRVCRHFHVPLQSGNDRILRRMNRHYTSNYYRRLIEALYDRVPDLCLGSDVMVGFPGEGEREFDSTVRLLTDLPMAYFHVFPYSSRPETPAATFDDRVPPAEKEERSLSLRNLSHLKQKTFESRYLGRSLPVLIESERDPESGLLRGHTGNYIRVSVNGPDSWKNRLIPVILRSVDRSGALGTPAQPPIIQPLAES